MTHYDQSLKMYAENGFRSAAEWLTLGRTVAEGTEPRAAATTDRGRAVALFTRDQTRRVSRTPQVH
jgi:hypothetical protein